MHFFIDKRGGTLYTFKVNKDVCYLGALPL